MKPKGIVLSPGPCTPNEAGICLDLIAKAGPKIPLLGVCLGHQAIGQAYGGKVVRAPVLMHGKLSTITHTGKGVFKALPKTFEVTRYHSLIVDREGLPESLEVTAETADGIIMGLQHKSHPGPWRAVPSGEHRLRARARAARQLPRRWPGSLRAAATSNRRATPPESRRHGCPTLAANCAS